eukprot:g3063.t1
MSQKTKTRTGGGFRQRDDSGDVSGAMPQSQHMPTLAELEKSSIAESELDARIEEMHKKHEEDERRGVRRPESPMHHTLVTETLIPVNLEMSSFDVTVRESPRTYHTVIKTATGERRGKELTLYFKEGSCITGKNVGSSVRITEGAEGYIAEQVGGRDSLDEKEARYRKAMMRKKEIGGLNQGEDDDEEDENEDPRKLLNPFEGAKKEGVKFGTWDGVFVTCMLNIFGVIMFLRTGFVVGQAGIMFSILIVLLSAVITTITTLSMSAIATNGHVRGGGPYYLISRCVGPSLGGSIGLLFTLGLCFATALFVLGFAETLTEYLHVEEENSEFTITNNRMNDMRLWGFLLMSLLLLIALIGVKWVIKIQLILFAFLALAVLSVILGTFDSSFNGDRSNEGFVGWSGEVEVITPEWFSKPENKTHPAHSEWKSNFAENLWPSYTQGGKDQNGNPIEAYDFFKVFGLFFPAVTGITAGCNISGLLENPSESIPKGTLHAILWSTVTYIVLIIVIGATCTRQALLENYTIMAVVDLSNGYLVLGGVYVATFSSALASIVGAPQLLCAVAKDNLFPQLRYFAVTHVRRGLQFVRCPFVEGLHPTFRQLWSHYLMETVTNAPITQADELNVLRNVWVMPEHEVRSRARAAGCHSPPAGVYDGPEGSHRARRAVAQRLYLSVLKRITRPHLKRFNTFFSFLEREMISVDRTATGNISIQKLLQIVDDVSEYEKDSVQEIAGKVNPKDLIRLLINKKIENIDIDRTMVRYGSVHRNGDPIRAYMFSFLIGTSCVMIGDVNAVAPLISIIFMITYSLINYSCFRQHKTNSPGWRPTFVHYNAELSILGAMCCIIIMFLFDVPLALVGLIGMATMYTYIDILDPEVSWGPASDAQKYSNAVHHLMRLRLTRSHLSKTFRPSLLVISDLAVEGLAVSGKARDGIFYPPVGVTEGGDELAQFAFTLRKGHGVMILGNVIIGDYEQDIIKLRQSYQPYKACTPKRPVEYSRDCCGDLRYIVKDREDGYALLETIVAPSLRDGARQLLQMAGVGILKPNILMCSFMESWLDKVTHEDTNQQKQVKNYVAMVQDAFKMRMGVMITRRINRAMTSIRRTGTVDVWWLADDGGLTPLMPYLMLKTKFWNHFNTRPRTGNLRTDKNVRLFRVVDSAVTSALQEMQEMRRLMARFGVDWDLNPISLGHEDDGRPDDKMPSAATVKEYNSMPVQAVKEQERAEWVFRWLRVAELIAAESADAKLVYITLPFPRSWVEKENWMGWVDILSRNLDCAVVFVRGNGRDCLQNLM